MHIGLMLAPFAVRKCNKVFVFIPVYYGYYF